ncbi:MAG TPA: hypothetical protein VFK78_07690 [Gemmatimonadales bacterium]|nr:hypothetical protein [Gemmatimonadales bacterium]
MNVTLLLAIACAAAWVALLATMGTVPGAVNLLYAAAMVLAARRIIAGAPRFRS